MTGEVKSAVRVLEVLEYFDSIQREAGVTEVARALGYPVSSTSVLLQTLAERGYVEQDVRRMYRPTPRVALLGAWIDPQLAPEGPVMQMMREFGEKTGETIILAVPRGMVVRYIYVVPATTTLRMHVGPGTLRPLATSGFGRVFLAGMADDDVRQVVADQESRLWMAGAGREYSRAGAGGFVGPHDRGGMGFDRRAAEALALTFT